MKQLTVKELMSSGVHFGHQVKRWNPKMAPYIYTVSNGSHIIDLDKTLIMLDEAVDFLKKKKESGKILFVGTKEQIQDIVAEKAQISGDYYINKRWPGGLLTNFKTVSLSLKKMDEYEKILAEGDTDRTKLELMLIAKEKAKLDLLYQGIRGFNGKPSALFVVDVKHEIVAMKEALKLGIPVVALVDTNADPTIVDYPIPGNDDAIKSVDMILDYVVENIK
ncbi:MAG: 30S ribosomal protein S2 [Patescibacteria group bacterium]